MKAASTIKKELAILEKNRKELNKPGVAYSEADRWENYGAAQALGWVLDRNYAKVSKYIRYRKPKRTPRAKARGGK